MEWLPKERPDVLLLQELKCEDTAFPVDVFHDNGYECAIFGQKTYNGVAICTSGSIEDITTGIPGFDDNQARVIEAVINGTIRIINVYAPNGQALDSDKFTYKLSFFKAFMGYINERLRLGEHLLIGGDFNIAPSDLDVYDPKMWHEKILCSTSERHAFRSLINLGLTDCLRALHPDRNDIFTWWDYRTRGFERHQGLRIDHFLASASVAENIIQCGVDTHERSQAKPSDHAPVWVDFSL
jgi:exodeoxyribonuclease-3